MSGRFGAYVHVPFCPAVCPYCDFNVAVRKAPPWAELALAIEAEIDARASIFQSRELYSVYFGGGTPSLASPEWVGRILASLRQGFDGPAPREVTLEVNPGTTDLPRLAGYRSAGVTRVSLGWQSTHDELLRFLGRTHSAAQSAEAAVAVRAAGFTELGVDLIFAVPGQSMTMLERDLDAIAALGPEHVSLYALTYHERTPLHRWRARGEVTPVAEEVEAAMMERIDARLTALGYEHYEVSNFALPGHRAVHNASYWHGVPYLGVGPGAHSFAREETWERGWRWESVRSVPRYLGAQARPTGLPRPGDASASWIEELTAEQLLAERVLSGVRLIEGIDLAEVPFASRHDVLSGAAARAASRGWLVREGTRLRPTFVGRMHADELAALLLEEVECLP